MLDPNNKEIWNGWDPPPGAEETWKEWLLEYKLHARDNAGYLTEEQIKNGTLPAGHDIPDWPREWKDLAAGYGGIPPPPWAYVPKNLGKPPQCYEPPLLGDCDESMSRFAYNPYVDECKEFQYSGCGGNKNNFLTMEGCEKVCINPVMGCDPDSDIPVPK
ncbi:unnamed protein product [Diatraea saccharalis]|uniref:BPTI/Kunitz inhibitor domain-containing protein n=1 Tax=Diatraea saccharalis TaxID=40085 RepID=A0A9N9WLB6_9NEOP|nr:unnamed protein product [Diatraea saccharalis]